jgi:predicted ATPase
LDLAQKQESTIPLIVGHRLMGVSLLWTGHIMNGKAHLDRALALYDPAEHHLLSARFGQDLRVIIFMYRSWANWTLGYPEAAVADAENGLKDARAAGRAVEAMVALSMTGLTHILCGNYARAAAQSTELAPLASEKTAAVWSAWATINRGCTFALTGKASEAVETITAGMNDWRSTGGAAYTPLWLSYLAKAYADLNRFEDARHGMAEAIKTIQTTGESWCEAEVNRKAGEITLCGPKPDIGKAESYFDRALSVAREQQAKSWELRASMSLARLWRDQGKVQQARELLAPVYGWFAEGFDTRDLKEAKALLEELAA